MTGGAPPAAAVSLSCLHLNESLKEEYIVE